MILNKCFDKKRTIFKLHNDKNILYNLIYINNNIN